MYVQSWFSVHNVLIALNICSYEPRCYSRSSNECTIVGLQMYRCLSRYYNTDLHDGAHVHGVGESCSLSLSLSVSMTSFSQCINTTSTSQWSVQTRWLYTMITIGNETVWAGHVR